MRDYKIYAKMSKILETRKGYLKEKDNEEKSNFLSIFNYCVNSMKDEYLNILNQTYLNPSYQFWWLDYYCKSSFYRKRFVAVYSFVSLFEMIYENFDSNSINFINS